MTDEQIIKALGCCATDDGDDCFQCPYGNIVYKPGNGGCVNRCRKEALDLIKRQKEEIEKLKVELKQKNPYEEYGNCVAIGDSLVFTHTLNDYDKLIKDIGAEAIKEFAKLIIDKSRNGVIRTADIPDLVKEMTEEK